MRWANPLDLHVTPPVGGRGNGSRKLQADDADVSVLVRGDPPLSRLLSRVSQTGCRHAVKSRLGMAVQSTATAARELRMVPVDRRNELSATKARRDPR
jgi:hypothetical protein